jgi:hypothetical protein
MPVIVPRCPLLSLNVSMSSPKPKNQEPVLCFVWKPGRLQTSFSDIRSSIKISHIWNIFLFSWLLSLIWLFYQIDVSYFAKSAFSKAKSIWGLARWGGRRGVLIDFTHHPFGWWFILTFTSHSISLNITMYFLKLDKRTHPRKCYRKTIHDLNFKVR